MAKYTITDKFKGYNSKIDATKLTDGYLVSGSQNVLSTDGENIKIREGYTLDGAANTATTPIQSSYDWNTHSNTGLYLRSYNDTLEWRYKDADDAITWTAIGGSWSSVGFNFTEWWDGDQNKDILIFVNGTSDIYSWSGGNTTVASATSNTITKEGDSYWAEERFTSTADYDKKLTINGVEYTYTGGEDSTLTGVTPDPTDQGDDSVSEGDLAVQTITTHSDTPANDDTVFTNDLVGVLNNHLFVGSTINRDLWISKTTDFTDYTHSSPRTSGEGDVLILDAYPVGLAVQEKYMYIAAGKDQWYKIVLELSNDLASEIIEVKRLKTTAQEAAISQGAISHIKNNIVYLSNEPTIDTLGKLEAIDTPQTLALSDPIKSELEGYDTSNAHIKYFRNNLYIALPSESLVLVYNIELGYWEAPQVLPIRRLAIIEGELYGHSNAVPETYKLFTGYNDNTNPIEAVAKFSYQNFGDRINYKNFDEFYSEGYIKSNTDLTLVIDYDYQGFTSSQEFTIAGNDNDILFQSSKDGSVGKTSYGKEPFGSIIDAPSDLAKFKQINTMVRQDFQEMQVTYKTNQVDGRWEVLAYGPATYLSSNKIINIKK